MPVAEVSVHWVGSSEGTAELIERLIVNVLKTRDGREKLCAVAGVPPDLHAPIQALTLSNAELYDVCNEKADAVARGACDPAVLRRILSRDLALCKARAAIRADLNARLGGEASGESMKSYGAGG